MLSAPLPWHIKHIVANNGRVVASLRDANDNLIGLIWDWRNAQAILDLFDQIEALREEIKELEK